MEQVQLDLNEQGRGSFFIEDGEGRVAYMDIAIKDDKLIAFHTEATERAPKGLGKVLLNEMVAYAREKGLKVEPLCPYVYAQFTRHAADYADLWQPGSEA